MFTKRNGDTTICRVEMDEEVQVFGILEVLRALQDVVEEWATETRQEGLPDQAWKWETLAARMEDAVQQAEVVS